jgi:hypothetical protein
MKKILAVLLMLTVLFAGCGKKNDTPSDTARIIGKWKTGASTLIYYLAGKEVYRVTTAATVTNDYSEFRTGGVLADFTYISGTNYSEVDGSWAISGSKITIVVQGQSQDYTFSFADDNTLNLTATVTGTTAYYSNGAYHTADSVTLNGQLNKF